MFPYLAFGHMIPYLELAKHIADKGHRVSFVSTPRNIARLPKLDPRLVPFIDFVKLPLPKMDNLPENAEATSDVPDHMFPILRQAYDALQKPLSDFLRSSVPDWILYDFAPYWVAADAAELGIKTAHFCIFIAASMGFLLPKEEKYLKSRTKPEHFTVSPPWVNFPTTLRFSYYEIKRFIDNFDPLSGPARVIKDCDIVAIRSCSEFEPQWLQLLETMYKKPVIPVGQLPTTEYDDAEDSSNETWQRIRGWLDKQEKGNVVYIAFGSESKPKQEDMNQIALGLEKSGLPFLWIFRTRRWEHDPEELKLPEGFEERTEGRGMVWTSWAPQLKILAHEAIGVFLSHSGWSSVVEAIQFEKSLVLFPCMGDQGLIAKLLEEKQTAYAIPRDEQTGAFSADDVAESLKLVLFKEEGKIYRQKIKEMKEIFANKDRQDRYINNFLDFLKANRNRKKEKAQSK